MMAFRFFQGIGTGGEVPVAKQARPGLGGQARAAHLFFIDPKAPGDLRVGESKTLQSSPGRSIDCARACVGIRQLIDADPGLKVCGEADSVPLAVTLAQDLRPDLVLVDLSLLESSGLTLVRGWREAQPQLQVLVLSMHDETHFAEIDSGRKHAACEITGRQ